MSEFVFFFLSVADFRLFAFFRLIQSPKTRNAAEHMVRICNFKNKRRLINTNRPSAKIKNLSHTYFFFCCYFMGKFLTCFTLSAIALRWKNNLGLLKFMIFFAPLNNRFFFLRVTST